MDSTPFDVQHDEARHRFVVRLPDGSGELAYRRLGPRVLEFYHTEVTPALRNRGIAGALVDAAVAVAVEQGDRIVPTCPFVRDWLKQHPERASLVAE